MSDINTNPAPATPPVAPAPAAGRRFYRSGWFIAGLAIVTGLAGFGLGRMSGHHRWGHEYSMGRHMQHGEGAGPSMRKGEFMIDRVLSRVDATSEQKAKISEIARSAMGELGPIREKHMATRDRLAGLMKAEKLDRAQIEQLRAEELVLADTLSKKMSEAFVNAAEVLTPAQRVTLVERWQNRRGWFSRG